MIPNPLSHPKWAAWVRIVCRSFIGMIFGEMIASEIRSEMCYHFGIRLQPEIGGNVRPSRWGDYAWKSTGTPETDGYAVNYRVPTSSRRPCGFSNIIAPSGRPVGNVPVDLWLQLDEFRTRGKRFSMRMIKILTCFNFNKVMIILSTNHETVFNKQECVRMLSIWNVNLLATFNFWICLIIPSQSDHVINLARGYFPKYASQAFLESKFRNMQSWWTNEVTSYSL